MKNQLAVLFYTSERGKQKAEVISKASQARGMKCNTITWLRIPDAKEFCLIHETMALIPESEQQMFLAQEDGLIRVNKFNLYQ